MSKRLRERTLVSHVLLPIYAIPMTYYLKEILLNQRIYYPNLRYIVVTFEVNKGIKDHYENTI